MKQSHEIALEIVGELTGRGGFDGAWDACDNETRDEITTRIMGIVSAGQSERIVALESALREIAGYEGTDESLDINAANMRRCAREALGLTS